MNRNKAKELLPIIEAFSKGRVIQSRHIKGGASLWYDVETPNFDNNDFDYRIKPDPKYRPFRDSEECWQEMQKHQPFGYTYDRFNNIRDCITKVATTGVSYDSPTVVISFEEVFDRFVFADGVPFGVKLEE